MKVICFGDSNTYGYDPESGGRYAGDSRWVDLLARQTGWQTCNQGENGRVIPVSAPAFPADTGYLVVMLGTNDLLQGRSPAAVTAGMERFLSGVALARGRILLIAPPPVREGAWVREKGVIDGARALGPCYRALAGRLGVRFADAGAWPIALADDGVHFTRQGHRNFAARLLGELGWTPADF